MKTLIEKEIRLLLPAFAAALVLAILPVWFLPIGTFEYGQNGAAEGCLFLFGIVLLALSSFGREIGLKTIPFALAQPMERSRIWWTKVEVLAVFLAVTFDALLLSVTLCSSFQPVRVMLPHDLGFYGLAVIGLTAGGLWLTLLLRQVVAALLLTVLIPLVAGVAIEAFDADDWVSITALAGYALAGFFLARRQFLRLQDTAWTGGVVSIGVTRAAKEQSALRNYMPWTALIRKELQLQQFTLAGMAALFVLHLGVILVRKAGAHTFNHTVLSALEMFGAIWLFMPLLAGSQSVAEERQLGTLDPLLCLPVSRRLQFGVKLISVLLIGGLLSALLICAAEEVANAMDAGANAAAMGIHFNNVLQVSFAFMALSLIGFYASTLTRGLVPALAVGLILSIVAWIIRIIAPQAYHAFGHHLWPVMGPPSLIAAMLWLAYGNFRWVFETGRRWRRNIFSLTLVFVLICGSTSAIYHRVWEWAMPLETAHGPARLPFAKPASIQADNFSLAVVLSDGRFWVHRKYYYKSGPRVVENHFVNGSNWLDAMPVRTEKVGIQSDGTLWVSKKNSPSGEMAQFGSETGWQNLQPFSYDSVILLKRDGTLWHWGPSDKPGQKYQAFQSSAPVRLGSDSDWARMVHGPGCTYAWKQDGSAWVLHSIYTTGVWIMPPSQVELAPGIAAVRVPGLDHIYFQSVASCPASYFVRNYFINVHVGVRDDGTLWYWNTTREWPMSRRTAMSLANGMASLDLMQIGRDSNWAAVKDGFRQLVALKTDGSIWNWKLDPERTFSQNAMSAVTRTPTETTPKILQKPPVQLGTHSDWIALGEMPLEGDNLLTLAADGTLWQWRGPDWREWTDEANAWLAPSRKPVKLENILDSPP